MVGEVTPGLVDLGSIRNNREKKKKKEGWEKPWEHVLVGLIKQATLLVHQKVVP